MRLRAPEMRVLPCRRAIRSDWASAVSILPAGCVAGKPFSCCCKLVGSPSLGVHTPARRGLE